MVSFLSSLLVFALFEVRYLIPGGGSGLPGLSSLSACLN